MKSKSSVITREQVETFLEKICGKVHLVILIKNRPALEISMCDKVIMVDVKNPILALALGLEQFFKKKSKADFGWLNELKKLGYNVKIKYKMLKFDI